jgi:hypothetical protein
MTAAIPLSILGRIGVIWGTKEIFYTRKKTSFNVIYRNCKPLFWRTLLINIPLMIGIGLGFGYISTMMVTPYLILCMLPWIIVLLSLLWIIKVIFEIAIVTLVIEDLEIIQAFKQGWQTIKTAIKEILTMGFFLSVKG